MVYNIHSSPCFQHDMLSLNISTGYETARSLALHGAHVVMACRNISSANECKDIIMKERPQALVEVMEIDLSSLSSVKSFADLYKQKQW